MSTSFVNGEWVSHRGGVTCPICGGCDEDQRGAGERCRGGTSADGKAVHCSREEHAGQAKYDDRSECWLHFIGGPCPCGIEHAPADRPDYRMKPKGKTQGDPFTVVAEGGPQAAPRANGKAKKAKLPAGFSVKTATDPLPEDVVLAGVKWALDPRPIDTVYTYRDEAGAILFRVVRVPTSDGGKKFFQNAYAPQAGKYLNRLYDAERVLYRLPELAAVDPAETVYLVEGEKDVDRLRSIGLIATTSPMGAKKWSTDYEAPLSGRNVVILPDNDDPGRTHAETVARSLAGVAASVAVVELPGLPEKGDVSDWLDQGGTAEDLAEIAGKTRKWTPEDDDIPWADVARPDDPYTIAALHRRQYKFDGLPTLIHHRGEFLLWRDSAYRPRDDMEVQGEVARTAHAHLMQLNADLEPKDRKKISTSVVNGVALALRSLSQIDGEKEEPCWLGDDEPFPADEVLPARNMLLHLPSLVAGDRATMRPTPAFYTRFSLDYDIDLNAPRPDLWHEFLDQVFPGDKEAVETLQEVFGLALTADTTQQKIFGLIGPKRAGKGVAARVLTALVGKANVAGQTLSAMAGNFGLAPLIGKRLCIVDDARLTGRNDLSIITERLLSISGEATLTVDVKHKPAWTGKLPTRLVILSNEIPRLPDSSGALAGRFIILKFTRTFYGKEDPGLTNKLLEELPGILLWAVEGWRRLNARGYFQQPASGGELIEQLLDLSSPVGQFIREECEVGPGREVVTGDLFNAWKRWCTENGRDHPGVATSFGRDLKAAAPEVQTSKPTTRPGYPKPVRLYFGIGLKVAF